MPDYIRNGTLIKDLQENEVVCEECQGSGLAIANNVYGLKGERGLNYKKQTIISCQSCYNGVRTMCEFCGELLERGYTKQCVCEGYKEYRREEEEKTESVNFNKAIKMTYKEYIEEYPDYMIYDVSTDRYFEDLDDLENYYEDEELKLPEYVYGTSRSTIDLDVDDIIESGCDDLYEDAHENLAGVEGLYKAVEEFNKRNETISATYYLSYKVAVIL